MNEILTDHPQKAEEIFALLRQIITEEGDRVKRLDNAPLGEVIDAAGVLNEFYKQLDELKESVGGVLARYKSGLIPKCVLNMATEQQLSFDAVKTQKADVFRATVGPRYSVSMPDQELGIKWLKENGHEDFVKETANAATLGKLAQELEQKAEELPDDVFKVNRSFSTTLTRHKPKL